MSRTVQRENEYDDEFVARLELIWGEGFLSPGGAGEVRAILEGTSLHGADVLDIGCGTGGVDILLVQEHGAKSVLGIDVEQPLIDRATDRAKEKGLSDSLEFRLIEPGPLSFDEASFDVVFSKDAIIQIPDKPSLFADILRILRLGGKFIASDWLASQRQSAGALQEFLNAVEFTATLETPETSVKLLESCGFVDVQVKDRTDWLIEETRRENELVLGAFKERAVELIGIDRYESWTKIRGSLLTALVARELRPSHLMATKPNLA